MSAGVSCDLTFDCVSQVMLLSVNVFFNKTDSLKCPGSCPISFSSKKPCFSTYMPNISCHVPCTTTAKGFLSVLKVK